MKDADLRSLLSTLSPTAREHLRNVLILDQPDRDTLALRLLHEGTEHTTWLADLIDTLTMPLDARLASRRSVRYREASSQDCKAMVRRCLLVLVAAVALVLLCVPAEAKGRDPVKAVIRGPGLVEPIVIRGSMGSGPGDRYWAFLLPMFGSLSDPSSESPLSTGDLGPRYFVDYVELCCGHRVRQYLYPYAAGGPVTYTQAGQRSDMFQMNMDDYIGSQTGWHRVATTLDTTSSFVGWHRVAATLLHLSFAQSGVNPTAAPATSNPSRVWLAIGISTLLLLMGLILIARRLSRTHAVLAGHGRAG